MNHEELSELDRAPCTLLHAPPSFGFRILSTKNYLKIKLDSGGERGLESFIVALIESGINTEVDILDEVSDITGIHREHLVKRLLTENENSHWVKKADGTYVSMPEL